MDCNRCPDFLCIEADPTDDLDCCWSNSSGEFIDHDSNNNKIIGTGNSNNNKRQIESTLLSGKRRRVNLTSLTVPGGSRQQLQQEQRPRHRSSNGILSTFPEHRRSSTADAWNDGRKVSRLETSFPAGNRRMKIPQLQELRFHEVPPVARVRLRQFFRFLDDPPKSNATPISENHEQGHVPRHQHQQQQQQQQQRKHHQQHQRRQQHLGHHHPHHSHQLHLRCESRTAQKATSSDTKVVPLLDIDTEKFQLQTPPRNRRALPDKCCHHHQQQQQQLCNHNHNFNNNHHHNNNASFVNDDCCDGNDCNKTSECEHLLCNLNHHCNHHHQQQPQQQQHHHHRHHHCPHGCIDDTIRCPFPPHFPVPFLDGNKVTSPNPSLLPLEFQGRRRQNANFPLCFAAAGNAWEEETEEAALLKYHHHHHHSHPDHHHHRHGRIFFGLQELQSLIRRQLAAGNESTRPDDRAITCSGESPLTDGANLSLQVKKLSAELNRSETEIWRALQSLDRLERNYSNNNNNNNNNNDYFSRDFYKYDINNNNTMNDSKERKNKKNHAETDGNNNNNTDDNINNLDNVNSSSNNNHDNNNNNNNNIYDDTSPTSSTSSMTNEKESKKEQQQRRRQRPPKSTADVDEPAQVPSSRRVSSAVHKISNSRNRSPDRKSRPLSLSTSSGSSTTFRSSNAKRDRSKE